jgi:predicted negative regulator of RcsB-dependent stress response
MKVFKNQSGIAGLEVVLILIVVAIVGLVGYKVYNTKKTVDNSFSQASSSVDKTTSASSVPIINSASDLNKTDQTLNQVNPDDGSSDEAQLNSQLSF